MLWLSVRTKSLNVFGDGIAEKDLLLGQKNIGHEGGDRTDDFGFHGKFDGKESH